MIFIYAQGSETNLHLDSTMGQPVNFYLDWMLSELSLKGLLGSLISYLTTVDILIMQCAYAVNDA